MESLSLSVSVIQEGNSNRSNRLPLRTSNRHFEEEEEEEEIVINCVSIRAALIPLTFLASFTPRSRDTLVAGERSRAQRRVRPNFIRVFGLELPSDSRRNTS